jgi:hypothetical protein
VLYTAYNFVTLHTLSLGSCKAFPEIEKIMKAQGVNVLKLFTEPFTFFAGLYEAISFHNLWRSISQISFKSSYDISFLPPTKNNWIVLFTRPLNYLVIFYSLYYVIYYFIKAFASKSLRHSSILLFPIFFVDICFFIFDATKNWYNINLEIFVLSLLLFYQANTGRNLIANKSPSLLNIESKLKLLIPISIFLSLIINYQYIYKEFRKGFEGPGFSISLNLNEFNHFIVCCSYNG